MHISSFRNSLVVGKEPVRKFSARTIVEKIFKHKFGIDEPVQDYISKLAQSDKEAEKQKEEAEKRREPERTHPLPKPERIRPHGR